MAVVNRDVLAEGLRVLDLITRQWCRNSRNADKIGNSQGKFVHQTKVYGVKASYVKLKIPDEFEQEENEDFPF